MPHEHETVTVPIYILEYFKDVLRIVVAARDESLLREILRKVECIDQKADQIMTQLETANAALDTINEATNSLGTIAQTISDELDGLLANATPGSTFTPEFITKAQALADKTGALVPVLQGIASKGAATPVPVPVPAPETPPAP